MRMLSMPSHTKRMAMGRQKAGGNGQLPKHALHGPYLKVSIRYRFTVLLPRTITNDRPTMPEPSHQSHPHTTVSPSTPFSTGQGFPISMWLHIAVRRDGFDTTSRPWRGFRVRCMTGGRTGLSRCMCWPQPRDFPLVHSYRYQYLYS